MRAFVALELPPELRRSLSERLRPLAAELPPARWVRTESFHVTLRFLGEIDAAAVERLQGPLSAAFGQCPPLRLRLTSSGCFPPARPARVAWLGVAVEGRPAAEGEPLRMLHARVGSALERELGVEPERRPYTPHVTVARCREPWRRSAVERFEQALAGGVGDPFPVGAGSLMESRLGAGGARYRRVAAYPLQGGAGVTAVPAVPESG